jgi:hypothetical protein
MLIVWATSPMKNGMLKRLQQEAQVWPVASDDYEKHTRL